MTINHSLKSFLENMTKEKGDKTICLILPSGLIRGTFVNHDLTKGIVNVSDFFFSDIYVGTTTISISTESILAWGKKNV